MRVSMMMLALMTAQAGLALAEPVDASRVTVAGTDPVSGLTTLVLDFEGLEHRSGPGSPLNDLFAIPMGEGAEIVALGMDVTVSTVGASLVAEALFVTEGIWPGFTLGVGVNDFVSASETQYFSELFYFSDFDLSSWPVGEDGVWMLEMFDSQVNNAGAGDLFYHSNSSLTLVVSGYVPAPSSAAAIVLASLAARRRRSVLP